jgi:MoaA/NifB/PqqE/SkfB family radical SAM enzyme
MRKTLHGVPAMIDLAHDLDADFLEVFPLHERASGTLDTWIQRDGGSFSYRDNLLSSVPTDELDRVREAFHSYAKSKGVPIQSNIFGDSRASLDFPRENEDWVRRVEKIDWNEKSIRCAMPFLEMFVHYGGAVHPCCWSLNPVGHLRNATLEEIWGGDVIRDTRADLVAGKVPKVCVGAACPYVKGQM